MPATEGRARGVGGLSWVSSSTIPNNASRRLGVLKQADISLSAGSGLSHWRRTRDQGSGFGVTFFDIAEVYGPFGNERLVTITARDISEITDSGGKVPGRGAPSGPLLQLERNLHAGAVGPNLSVVKFHVKLDYLGNAEITQGL